MTISNIDPLTPGINDVAGQGDDQIRALKGDLVNQFQGEVGDLYDIPILVGPRSLNLVNEKADQADLDATDANVATNTTQIGLNTTAITDQEVRLAAIEADYTTADQAGNIAWPVGSLFISADGGTPTAKGLPGTWTVVGDGRVLLGDPTTGTEAGANEVTLTAAQIPQHQHKHTGGRDAGTTGALPSYATNPPTPFNEWKTGSNSTNARYAEMNTDQGIGLQATPDPVDVRGAHLTVRFYERTA